MVTKTILLLVAYQGYQPYEYGITRDVLEKAGIKVVVASNKPGTAHAMPTISSNPYDHVHVDLEVNNVKVTDYDGIFLIGGPGALQALDTSVVHKLIKDADTHHKYIGAICISPRILARAGILQGKSATGWNDDGKLDEVFKNHTVTYVKKPVVIDGRIITADGPQSAEEFGKTIVKAMGL